MKLLLDIPDDKANAFLEVFKNISIVKIQQLTDSKAVLLSEVREAVEEMKLIKSKRKKARNAEDFLNEI